ncbi:MAG: hypothetical protein OXG87_17665 [Gemmatimonadetes bacterium]|nr:hypothetical protein [Gemmatimonadota bacterium]
MRQIIVLCFLAICVPSESFGEGIFGLKKGMTLEKIKKLDFGHIKQYEDESNLFFVEQPKKPQGADYVYFVMIPEMGLMKVRFSWVIEANSYGDELKRKFNELESILSKKYGEGEKIDLLKPDAVWDKPRDYMESLENNERELSWYSIDIPYPNKAEVEVVVMEAGASRNPILFLTDRLYEGFVNLDYYFQGFHDYLERENSQF